MNLNTGAVDEMLFSNFCCCRIWYWQYVQFMGALLVVVHFIHELNKRKLSHSFFISNTFGETTGDFVWFASLNAVKTLYVVSFVCFELEFFFSPRKRTIHNPNSEGFWDFSNRVNIPSNESVVNWFWWRSEWSISMDFTKMFDWFSFDGFQLYKGPIEIMDNFIIIWIDDILTGHWSPNSFRFKGKTIH